MNKRLYIAGITLGSLIVALTAIVFLKKPSGGGEEEESGTEGDISPQSVPDAKLMSALNSKSLVGKVIRTKVNNVKLRTTAVVNDGFINNVYDEVPQFNTVLGTAVSVHSQDVKNPTTGRNFVWVRFKLDKNTFDKIQENRPWYSKANNSTPPLLYVREDVIKL